MVFFKYSLKDSRRKDLIDKLYDYWKFNLINSL